MDAKDEIRSRLNIEDVIGEYVELKRAGRNFKGLSPFGNERTPSFIVSPDKQIWHDFSSNRGGDIFSFIMEIEGMDFRQSLEHLARKAGVDLSLYQNKSTQAVAQKKKRFLEMHNWAARYFQHSMVKNTTSMEYIFKKRMLSKQIVQEFRIGYAPNAGKALLAFLEKKGYKRRDIAEAGLLNRFDGDLFRGRMTVPLMDASGQVIGFTGRIIGEVDNAPKYLNTPQTILYDKSRHVFGLSQAKEAIRTHDRVVIVEGNLDVVSSHQVGVKHVVATAGTAMTEYHLQALKRLTVDIRLAFDGDKAGIAATERAIGLASKVGVDLTIISLPGDAKDPDELIQQDPRLWEQAIDGAQPAVDWILVQYERREDITTARGKRAFTSAGLRVVATLQDPIERDHYEKKIATIINSTQEAVVRKAKQFTTETHTKELKKPAKSVQGTQKKTDTTLDDILAIAMLYPDNRTYLQDVDEEFFTSNEQKCIHEYLRNNPTTHHTQVCQDLPDSEIYVKMVVLRGETRYANSSSDVLRSELARLIRMRKNEQRKQKQAELIEQLKQAEEMDDETGATQIRVELNNLIKEIAHG